MSDILYWIGLSLVDDIGPVMSKKLLSLMETPENIFNAEVHDLLSVKGMSREKAEGIKNFSLWSLIDRHMNVIRSIGFSAVSLDNEMYPEPLKELPDSPVVLYMKGDYHPEDRYAIAVVGSRKFTDYGEAVSQRISGELASAGFTVVSGMARGIDTMAHKGAIVSGGRTIAVSGCGPDICYPPENRQLMDKISASGCVLSEFPPGTAPNRENFPQRNRLISGLSLGVLVVEAASSSGALITAHYALEQNKEVFAIPGNITSVNSAGANMLLKQGAKIVLGTEDIIEELAPVLRGFIRQKKVKTPDMDEEESRLCSHLSGEPRHIDILARESGLPAHKILGLLLSLELKGVARQADGKRFYLSQGGDFVKETA